MVELKNGHYIAICKETKEEWVVYSLYYSGFPVPTLNHVAVLLNDHSGYEDKFVDEVDIYFCED